jgi:hypothetical protein
VDKSEVAKLEKHLRRTFANQSLNIMMPRDGAEFADVQVGEVRIGRITVDDEDGDRSFNFEMEIPATSSPEAGLGKARFTELEGLLRRIFGNHSLRIMARPKKTDSAEVYVGEEFIGVIYVDDEKGDRSFNFQMAILSEDLQG